MLQKISTKIKDQTWFIEWWSRHKELDDLFLLLRLRLTAMNLTAQDFVI